MKKNINFITRITPVLVVFIIFMGFTRCSSNNDEPLKETIVMSETAFEFKSDMRKVWEEHSFWTRNIILCIIDDLPGIESATKRLLQNQVDIGDMIKPYYGKKNGDKLAELLTTHIIIGEEVFMAIKSHDIEMLEKSNNRWYVNSDEICEFLYEVNPNWELAPMKMMMYDHLKLTSDIAEQRASKDYYKDVKAHDLARDEILIMADMLSEGLFKQFPEKFQ